MKGYRVGFTRDSLKNKTKSGCNIFTNFREYSMRLPSVFRADINQVRFLKKVVDVVVCDPPYGFRAMSRENTGKTETKNFEENSNIDYVDPEFNPYVQDISFKPLKHCDVDSIFDRLLNTSNDILSLNGLVVCLFPYEVKDEDKE